MKYAAIAFAVASLAAALRAARLWYASSALPVPDHYTTPILNYETGLHDPIRDSAKLNQRAAIWTGVASVLAALSVIAGSFS